MTDEQPPTTPSGSAPAPQTASVRLKPPLGSPEWEAEMRAIEAERENSKVYQLAFWPDDQRAMPTDFLACALFAALHGKNTQYLRGERIATVNGYTVAYTGKRLTQVHADIVMGALHLMRGLPQGDNVQFRIRSFLRLIGRHTGKTDRDSFRQLVDDVIATSLRITTPDGKMSYSGSILTKAKDVTDDEDTLFVLEVNRELAKLFMSGFGTIDWEKRKALMRQPLCLWLQLYFSKFGTKPVAVTELHRLSGSTAPLKKFRQNLRTALTILAEKDIVHTRFDREADSVHREPPISALRPPQPSLPQTMRSLPSRFPPVSATRRKRRSGSSIQAATLSGALPTGRHGSIARNSQPIIPTRPSSASRRNGQRPPPPPHRGNRSTRSANARNPAKALADPAWQVFQQLVPRNPRGNRGTGRGTKAPQNGNRGTREGVSRHRPGGSEAPDRGLPGTRRGNQGTARGEPKHFPGGTEAPAEQENY